MKCDSILIDDPPGDEHQQLTPRSRLYCLAPIGLGTGDVESATSYLSRLAIAHCVSTWLLLKCEIAPRLFGPDAILRNRLSELSAAMGSAFNGENDTSKKFIALLSSLTGRDDLGQTTMGFCHGFVGPRFLVRVKQAWCGPCFSEWKANGSGIYYPLLWHVLGVKACPRHGIPLGKECPVCNRSFHPLTAHSRPGYCPRCGHWLGSTANERAGTGLELAGEVATAQRISDFLCNGPNSMAAVSASAFPKNIEQLLNYHFNGNVAALARFLAVNRSSVLAWKGGVHRPTLLSLADLSLRVKSPMADLLSTQLGAADFTLQTDGASQPRRRRFLSPPKTDLEKMRQVLEAAANNDVFPNPSLSQLAIQLGCNQSTLQRRFPELAQKIKERYQEYEAIRKEVRAKLFRSIVSMTVIDIHKAGIYPSQCRVRQSLPKWVDMREPAAQDEWKQTLAKLNYTTT
jgi:hypothetical protein